MEKVDPRKYFKKILVSYPDGTIDCDPCVTKTYRRTVDYAGLERVRALNIRKNSINIVSTIKECRQSTGKKEFNLLKENSEDLVICTQFSTEAKYKHLCIINQRLNLGLSISLEQDPSNIKPGNNNPLADESGIYRWVNKVTGNGYVGQAIKLRARSLQFQNFFTSYAGEPINEERRKYPSLHYWDYTILEKCNVEILDEMEIHWINKCKEEGLHLLNKQYN